MLQWNQVNDKGEEKNKLKDLHNVYNTTISNNYHTNPYGLTTMNATLTASKIEHDN